LPKHRWLTPTLQSIALMLLLCGMTLGAGRCTWPAAGGADYLAASPAFACGTRAVPADTSSAISELTRDLSYTTSHNALSAAGVAFSVKQLATNCNRNSTRRRRLSATPK
jgi:methyl-accepting chemotaxis protein